MSDDHDGFKAFQAEHGADSSIVIFPDGTQAAAFIRVFKDEGSNVRLGFQFARKDAQDKPKHIQIAVNRERLLKLLNDPLDPEPAYGPDA